jgi:L-asparaginase
VNAKQHSSVVVIGTGGTIAAVAETRADFQTYRGGARKTLSLLDELQPELSAVAITEAVDVDGGCRTLRDFHSLTLLVDEHLQTHDAAVVLCGTRSLEEVAYWLDLTVRSPKPVIVTGSVRPWNAFGSDGPANLHNAVRLAASARTDRFGTVVMLNDRIMTAREVTKTNTLRLDAFQVREWGTLGVVDSENIRLLRAPARVDDPQWSTPFDLTKVDPETLPRTEIVYSYADAGGDAITAFAENGAAGMVMAGDPSDRQGQALKQAAGKGVVIVAANRNVAGAVYETGVPVIISAEDLLPQKARLLLTLGLTKTKDISQLRTWFHTHGVPQFGL